jgi:hypothetical protein
MLGRSSGQQRRLAPLLPLTQASSAGAAAMSPVPLPSLPPHPDLPTMAPEAMQRTLQVLAQRVEVQRQLLVLQPQLAAPPTVAPQAELAAVAAWAQSPFNSTTTNSLTPAAANAGAAPTDMDVVPPDFSASQHDPGSEQVRAHA